MKIALVQMRIYAGDLKKNFFTMQQKIKDAQSQQADIVVFSELCLPGYFLGDTWEHNSFLKDCETYHQQLLQLSYGIVIIFGSVGIDWKHCNEDGRPRKYSAAFVAQDGQWKQHPKLGLNFWPKTLSPNYGPFDDSRYFFDIQKIAIEKNMDISEFIVPLEIQIHNKNMNIMLLMCEDMWDKNYSQKPMLNLTNKHNISAIFNLSASPYNKDKRNKRRQILKDIFEKHKIPICYINNVGIQNLGKTIFLFDGQTCCLNSIGDNTELAPFDEDILWIFWDKTSGFKALNERYTSGLTAKKSLDKTADLQQSLEQGLLWCLQEWNIKHVVIGASGGIDSAVAATLYSRVLGSKNVFLINMPSRFNSDLTQQAALELAKNLDCPFVQIPIESSVTLTLEQLKGVNFNSEHPTLNVKGVISENIQSRDRGARLLASVAAALNGVFSCNANKAELTIGYSTLYGDNAGFLAPLADLWKYEIYALARHYNKNVFGKIVIPLASLNVIPSAELSLEQDITQNKGDPLYYPYHDHLFRSWIEPWIKQTPTDLINAYINNTLEDLIGCEQGLVKKLFPDLNSFTQDLERWWKAYRGMGVVKRVQSPPILALSKRCFGLDHRESICGPIEMDESYLQIKKSFCKS